ncbi:hypothetical protein ACSSS7_002329 [Eimeria intestinalis]
MAQPVDAAASGGEDRVMFASGSSLASSYRSGPHPLGFIGKEAEDECLFSEAEAAPPGRLAEEVEADDESTFRILIATDTHLGFKGEDPVRGNDSFRTFEEILQIGRKERVDFVLHGGDLFDENKPSRTTLYRAMCLLRKYCFGSGMIQFDVLSTAAAAAPAATGEATQPSAKGAAGGASAAPPGRKEGVRVEAAATGRQTQTKATANSTFGENHGMATDVFRFGLNYLNENVNVCMPIFAMHGNHGEDASRVTHSPWERAFSAPLTLLLACTWRFTAWDGYETSGFTGPTYKGGHGAVPAKNCVLEKMLPSFADVVIWGHEHDCHTELRQSREGRCQVLQPGSSIATSLTAGEAQQKHVFILETVRPLIVEDVSLADICQGGSGSRRLAPPSAPTDPREAAADREAWGALTSLVEDILRRYSQVAGIDLTASATLPVSQQQQQKPQQPRRRQAYQLFCNYRAGATQDLASAPAASAGGPLGEAIVERKPAEVLQRLPLVRVRVEHSGFSTISAPRFASQFVGRVANPDSLLCFYKKRQSHLGYESHHTSTGCVDALVVQREVKVFVSTSQLVDTIFHYMEGANGLSVLSEPDFNDAVQDFAVKMDPSAISAFVASSISAARMHARAELLRRLKVDSETPQSAEDDFTQANRMRRLNVEDAGSQTQHDGTPPHAMPQDEKGPQAFPEAEESPAGEMAAPESFSSAPCGLHGVCTDRRKNALASETRVRPPRTSAGDVDLEVPQVSDGEGERPGAATSGASFGTNTQKAGRRGATRKPTAGGRGARGRGGAAGQKRRQAPADVLSSSDDEATATGAPEPPRPSASAASGGVKQQKDIRSLLSQLVSRVPLPSLTPLPDTFLALPWQLASVAFPQSSKRGLQSQSIAGARPDTNPPYVPTQESEGTFVSQTQGIILSESISTSGASRRLLPAKRVLPARLALPLGAPRGGCLSTGANGKALDAAAGALSWTKRAKHNEALVDDEGLEDSASSLLLRGSLCTSLRPFFVVLVVKLEATGHAGGPHGQVLLVPLDGAPAAATLLHATFCSVDVGLCVGVATGEGPYWALPVIVTPFHTRQPATMSLPRGAASAAGPPSPQSSKIAGQASVVEPGPPPPLPSAFSPDSLEWEEWRGDWPFIHHAVAGSFAGVMEHITMYPIDTIKTRMQAFRGAPSPADSPRPCGPRGPTSGPLKGDRMRCGADMSQAVASPSSDAAGRGAERQRRFLSSSASSQGFRQAPTPGACGVGAGGGCTQRLPWAWKAGGFPTASSLWWSERGWSGRLARSRLQGTPPPVPPWTICATARGESGSAELRPGLLATSAPASRQRLFTRTAWPSSSCAEAIRGRVSSARAGGSVLRGQARGTVLTQGTGLVAGLRSVYLEGGLLGLYRGAGAVAAGCVPAHACYFMSYEFVKESMGERARMRQRQQQQLQNQPEATAAAPAAPVQEAGAAQSSPAEALVALGGASSLANSLSEEEAEVGGQRLTHGELLACGMCATFSHDLILTPVDVVKQRMQLGCFRSLTECVTSTLRREGPLAFVRSLPVSVLLNLPHGATLVYVNETLKNSLITSQPSALPSLPAYFFCAGESGHIGIVQNVVLQVFCLVQADLLGLPVERMIRQQNGAGGAACNRLHAYPLCKALRRSGLSACLFSGVSGGVAGFISNPLDVVKTRLQTQDCAIRESRAALAGVLRPGSCAFAPCPPKYNVSSE